LSYDGAVAQDDPRFSLSYCDESGLTRLEPIAVQTTRTYGHVIEELEDAPRISAEDAIASARRDNDVRQKVR
jgi:hypothetical protein